jgi:iron complex outermembrane receptor protein
MNAAHARIALFCAGAALALPGIAWSQSTADSTSAPKKEEVTVLPKFTVSAESVSPYQATQALSSSRVAMNIQDIPQSISVVTSDFIKDSMSYRMLDAAKYVTPVVESTLPFGGDRYTIRGFQVSHEFIDGAEISGQDGYSASLMPYNIDRVEIIKGPNAILVPGGSPGGQFNPITKSPVMKNQASATLELAQYFTTAFSTDINRIVSQDRGMAARLVFAYWDNDGYEKNQFRTGYLIAPSFSWQLSPNNQLVIRAEFMQNRETNLGGLPLDPGVGTASGAIDGSDLARGLPRDWSFGDRQHDFRHRATERITADLYSTLSDHVTSRLQLMANHVTRLDWGGTNAAISSAGGGSRNPFTGLWEPGVNWSVTAYNNGTASAPASTAAPITDPSTWIYTRNATAVNLFYNEAHLRNDYAAKFDTNFVKSTTIAGVAANFSKVQFKVLPGGTRPSVPNNNLGSITYPDWGFQQPTQTNGGGNRTGKQEDAQLFVYESAGFLRDHLILSGGVSRFFGQLSRVDSTGIPPANTYPTYNLSTTAKSFGATVKPIKEVSLFYGYNTTGGTMPSSLNPGTFAPDFRNAAGTQKEFGVKTTLLGERLTASVAHFDIQQQNYAVPNSEYYTLIAQGRIAEANALPNPLYLNLSSKGWEFESTFAVSKNLTLLGNFTDYKVRQPVTNVRVRGVPDRSWAVYGDYRFTEGLLRGFGVNVGVDYKGDVAGDIATGYTTTRPLPDGTFVPNQPSFYIAGRTLVNLGFSYHAKDWTARLQINNLFDKDYVLAALSRTSVIAGDPRNIKASFTYNF